jgi:hypothetical protein
VQVVVVPCERLDDSGRAAKAGVGPDEDQPRSRTHEEIDKRLREPTVDLGRIQRRALPPVEPRVVDVHVEAVLMRGVPGTEPATPPSTEITDPDSPSGGVLAGIRRDHIEHDSNERIRSPPPPGAIRPPVEKRIPGEERRSTGGELDSPRQPPGGRSAESPGVVPANGPVRRSHEAGRYSEGAGEPAGDDRQQDQAE